MGTRQNAGNVAPSLCSTARGIYINNVLVCARFRGNVTRGSRAGNGLLDLCPPCGDCSRPVEALNVCRSGEFGWGNVIWGFPGVFFLGVTVPANT